MEFHRPVYVLSVFFNAHVDISVYFRHLLYIYSHRNTSRNNYSLEWSLWHYFSLIFPITFMCLWIYFSWGKRWYSIRMYIIFSVLIFEFYLHFFYMWLCMCLSLCDNVYRTVHGSHVFILSFLCAGARHLKPPI